MLYLRLVGLMKSSLSTVQFMNSKVLFKQVRHMPKAQQPKPVSIHVNYHPGLHFAPPLHDADRFPWCLRPVCWGVHACRVHAVVLPVHRMSTLCHLQTNTSARTPSWRTTSTATSTRSTGSPAAASQGHDVGGRLQ